MLLRIFLILSILAGAGIIALTHFQVRPHVQSIIDKRNSETARANVAEDGLRKTKAELATTKSNLQQTREQLSDTTAQLTAANKKVEEQTTLANSLKGQLDKTKNDLTVARQDLGAWTNLGIPVNKVREMIDEHKKLLVANSALDEEKKVMQGVIDKLRKQLETFTTGLDQDGPGVPMQAGLKGKILVVDPKWDFVVLDIGDKDGVVQNGVMMVSRDAKLIGKVRIVSVQANRSIANIMSSWKLGEVMEGDQVIY